MQMHVVLVNNTEQTKELAFCKSRFHEILIDKNPVFYGNHKENKWTLAQKIMCEGKSYDLWLNVFVPGNLFNKK
jgi:hypothetical protein